MLPDQGKKVVVAVTGASGSIYASVLLDKLVQLNAQISKVGVVLTDNAKDVWKYEMDNSDYERIPFDTYDRKDFFAPFASGSARYDTMIICPCSMGMMSRIAAGISDDLISRAADVMLKERRRLILVIRDTPYSLVHINAMKTITEAGGIICPATPSFYSKPKDFNQLAATVIDRVIDLAGFRQESFRWSE